MVLSPNEGILGVQEGGGLWQIIEELADGIYNYIE